VGGKFEAKNIEGERIRASGNADRKKSDLGGRLRRLKVVDLTGTRVGEELTDCVSHWL
jgi:hypothetical protein